MRNGESTPVISTCRSMPERDSFGCPPFGAAETGEWTHAWHAPHGADKYEHTCAPATLVNSSDAKACELGFGAHWKGFTYIMAPSSSGTERAERGRRPGESLPSDIVSHEWCHWIGRRGARAYKPARVPPMHPTWNDYTLMIPKRCINISV